jgi:hypothetical protein
MVWSCVGVRLVGVRSARRRRKKRCSQETHRLLWGQPGNKNISRKHLQINVSRQTSGFSLKRNIDINKQIVAMWAPGASKLCTLIDFNHVLKERRESGVLRGGDAGGYWLDDKGRKGRTS